MSAREPFPKLRPRAAGREERRRHARGARRANGGLTLIELMIALAIGALLMIGALTALGQSRETLRVADTLARMQETARFALDVLELDVRMAQHWGLTSRTHAVAGRARGSEPHAGIGPSSCGPNWAVALDDVVATNNGYGFACSGLAPVAAESDTLVVRRVAPEPVSPPFEPAGVYVQSALDGAAQLFAGANGVPPGFAADTSATYRLVVNGYYVSRRSSLGADVPSLRRKTLRTTGTIGDEEVLPYVEDMQVRYGVDTHARGAPERGSVSRYVDADDPLFDPASPAFLPDAVVLAVRIWLRVRAERQELGYADAAPYVYADCNFGTFADGFRRLVVSKTIHLRNARPGA